MVPAMKTISTIVGIWVFIFSIVSPSGAQQDKSSRKAKWEKTLQAAKKEGTVTVYGGAEITHPEILKVFKKRYPDIKVVTVSGHSEVIQRIVAERRARKYLADVFSYGPNAARTAYLANFLQPLAPHLMLPDVNDMTAWYRGQHFYRDPQNKYIFLYEGTPGSSSMAYNTNKLTDLSGIRSYWDILDPKWRGEIGFLAMEEVDPCRPRCSHSITTRRLAENFCSDFLKKWTSPYHGADARLPTGLAEENILCALCAGTLNVPNVRGSR